MDPAQLKKNFTEQIEKTEVQIRELEENLAKAREYKLKLTGGLETLGLLEGEGELKKDKKQAAKLQKQLGSTTWAQKHSGGLSWEEAEALGKIRIELTSAEEGTTFVNMHNDGHRRRPVDNVLQRRAHGALHDGQQHRRRWVSDFQHLLRGSVVH